MADRERMREFLNELKAAPNNYTSFLCLFYSEICRYPIDNLDLCKNTLQLLISEIENEIDRRLGHNRETVISMLEESGFEFFAKEEGGLHDKKITIETNGQLPESEKQNIRRLIARQSGPCEIIFFDQIKSKSGNKQ